MNEPYQDTAYHGYASNVDELQQSYAFLEAVLDGAGTHILVMDREGRVVRFNHACEQLTGFNIDQVRGKPFWTIFPLPEGIESMQQRFAERLAGPTPKAYENYYLAHDGTQRLIAWTTTALLDDHGELEYLVATGTDITERKEAEQLLVAQKWVLELIATSAPFSTVLEAVCHLVEAHVPNSQCSILILDKPTQTLYHGAAPSLPQAYQQAINGSAIGPRAGSCGSAAFWGWPVIVTDIANDPLWADYRSCALMHGLQACWSTPITSPAGDVVATFAIYYATPHEPTPAELTFVQQVVVPLARIVVERKTAEEALTSAHADQSSLSAQLRQSRDVLRTLFDGLSAGLLLLQREGTVIAANQAAATLLGTTPHALVYMSWRELCADTSFNFPGQFVFATFRDGRLRHQRERYQRPNAPGRVLDMQALPLINEAGVVDQVVVSLVDSTEQVQLEALAMQNERQAASGRLAATIAHDLNTPLQSIKHCLYLAENALPDDRATYMRVAREELDRISGVLRQMLHLHRRHSEQQVLVDLNNLLDRVLLLIGSTLAERNIRLETCVAVHLPLMWGYPEQLTQVFLNLLLNAVDAMQGGGVLRVTTALAQSLARLGVAPATVIECLITDSGPGIGPEILARIFEPFFTTKQDEGTGLGLAITHKIVLLHGGTIDVVSELGQGTTFTLRFPLGEAVGEP